MKQAIALIISLILVLSCSVGCSNNQNENNSGNIDEGMSGMGEMPGYTVDTDEDVTTHKPPVLEEISNTGDIPYSYYSKSVYNSNLYGDYSEYFENELFVYRYNNKYGYADDKGNILIKEQYDKAGVFSENKAFVQKDGVWNVIDTTGKILYTLSDYVDSNYCEWDSTLFQNDLAVMVEKVPAGSKHWDLKLFVLTSDFEFSVIDIDVENHVQARVINTPEFAGLLTYYLTSERDASADTGYKFTDVYVLYDTQGNIVWTVSDKNRSVSEKYNNASKYIYGANSTTALNPFSVREGYINVPNAEGQWGLFDIKNKEFVIECSYEYVGGISEGLIPIRNYGKWGYIDLDGNIQIKSMYSLATDFRNGRAFVITDDNSPVIIGVNGEILAEYNLNWPKSNYSIFRPSAKSDITVITYGNRAYKGTPEDIYVLDNYGNVLISRSDCAGLYVSEEFVFVDHTDMYKITRV